MKQNTSVKFWTFLCGSQWVKDFWAMLDSRAGSDTLSSTANWCVQCRERFVFSFVWIRALMFTSMLSPTILKNTTLTLLLIQNIKIPKIVIITLALVYWHILTGCFKYWNKIILPFLYILALKTFAPLQRVPVLGGATTSSTPYLASQS